MTPQPATLAGFGKGFALLHSVPALRVPSALAPWRREGVGTGNVASRLCRDVLAPCRGGVEQGTDCSHFVRFLLVSVSLMGYTISYGTV